MDFDWDEANEEHVRRHAVEPFEAEAAWHDRGATVLETRRIRGERRQVIVGRAPDGRILLVVVTPRSGHLRVVTARAAEVAERRRYLG